MTHTIRRTFRAATLRALPVDLTTDDTVMRNGRAIVHNGEAWAWRDSGGELSFDECEQVNLDGSGRRY